MAHFASIDSNNVVTSVLVVDNADIQNLPFPDSESVGAAFLNSFLPQAEWKQTSYNGNFRFRFAGIGYKFHPECGEHGGFSLPPEYDYFVLNTEKCVWEPPVPYPNDGHAYYWNDPTRSWIKLPSFTSIG